MRSVYGSIPRWLTLSNLEADIVPVCRCVSMVYCMVSAEKAGYQWC